MRKPSSYAVAFLLASLFILSALPAMGADKYSKVTLTFKNMSDREAYANVSVQGGDGNNRGWDWRVPPNGGSRHIDVHAKAPDFNTPEGLYNYLIQLSYSHTIGPRDVKYCFLKFANDTEADILGARFTECNIPNQATLQVQGTTLKSTITINK